MEVTSQPVGLVPAVSCPRRIKPRSTSDKGWLAIYLINKEIIQTSEYEIKFFKLV
jgi:hypothetical protein